MSRVSSWLTLYVAACTAADQVGSSADDHQPELTTSNTGTAGGSFAASVAALAQPADHSSAEHQGLQAEPAEQLDAVADLHASPSKAEPTPAPEQSVDKPHPDHETATSELQIDDTPEPADLRAINAVMQSSEAANSDDAAASPSSAASVSQRRPSLAPRDDNDAIKVQCSAMAHCPGLLM